MTIDPWRGSQFADGYSAEFKPENKQHWQYLRGPDGKVRIFPTRQEAKETARKAYLSAGGNIQETEEEAVTSFADALAAEVKAFQSRKREVA